VDRGGHAQGQAADRSCLKPLEQRAAHVTKSRVAGGTGCRTRNSDSLERPCSAFLQRRTNPAAYHTAARPGSRHAVIATALEAERDAEKASRDSRGWVLRAPSMLNLPLQTMDIVRQLRPAMGSYWWSRELSSAHSGRCVGYVALPGYRGEQHVRHRRDGVAANG
jgi:hypothetical protein